MKGRPHDKATSYIEHVIERSKRLAERRKLERQKRREILNNAKMPKPSINSVSVF